MSCILTTDIHQNVSKQDFILSGTINNFQFILVADGHGKRYCY